MFQLPVKINDITPDSCGGGDDEKTVLQLAIDVAVERAKKETIKDIMNNLSITVTKYDKYNTNNTNSCIDIIVKLGYDGNTIDEDGVTIDIDDYQD